SNEALTASNEALLNTNKAIKLEQGKLKGYVQQREQILQGLNNKLLEIYGSTAWNLIQRLWKIRLWIAPKGSGREKLAYSIFKLLKRIIRKPSVQIPENNDLELIRSSYLFDNAWYLASNPDVAKSKMDIALHFLIKGGFEGLDPSPLFSTVYYLNQYEDVKISGMNPLLHYLRYGKYEMRRILPSDSEEQLGPTSKTTKRTVPNNLISPAIFLKQLRSMKKSDQYAISISHDNYLGVDAGVQLCIADQQQAFNHIGKGYLHIYPYEDHDSVTDESLYVGISFDGKELGIMKFKDLLHGIKQISTMKINDIHIHHLKGINIKFVNELLALDDHHGKFWVHDQYSICPSTHLMRNDTTFCDAPDINSNACSICKYSMARKQKQGELLELFKTNKFEVIAPSKFALEYWKDKFPYKKVNGKVIPHVILKWTDNKPEQKRNNTLRIAFVGRSFEYKGWKTWMNIVEEFSGKNKYRFFHFSSQPGATGDYEWVPTRVTASNRTAMIETLRDHTIDIALLWSTTAETFSFTLHEALAAGCFVITNKESGNIQAAIKRHQKRGLVLNDEKELITLMKSNKLKNILKEYHKDGRPQAKFIINNKME
ncbi:MAG: glycosyltransferase, partial [Calditrichaceae bacterium]|nr:glycosyltransferase [Calditrichaceae bacterium]